LVLKASEECEIGQRYIVVNVKASVATCGEQAFQCWDAVRCRWLSGDNAWHQTPVATPMSSPEPLLVLEPDVQTPNVF
jgi:hypothetical protein